MYVLLKAVFFGIAVPGWTSLILAILFTCGVMLINLGICALYIGKTFQQVKMRPRFVIAHLRNEKRGVGSGELPVV